MKRNLLSLLLSAAWLIALSFTSTSAQAQVIPESVHEPTPTRNHDSQQMLVIDGDLSIESSDLDGSLRVLNQAAQSQLDLQGGRFAEANAKDRSISILPGLGQLLLRVGGTLRVGRGVTIRIPNGLHIVASEMCLEEDAVLEMGGDLVVDAAVYRAEGTISTAACTAIDDHREECAAGECAYSASGSNGSTGSSANTGSHGKDGYCDSWGGPQPGASGGGGYKGGTGAKGADACSITLNVGTFAGGDFAAYGGEGGVGGRGGNGGSGGDGPCCTWGCDDGRSGGNGGQGGDGGRGGNGGVIRISYCELVQPATWDVSYGEGSKGGNAGSGGSGGQFNEGCVWICADGRSGSAGQSGGEGTDGSNGTYSASFSQAVCDRYHDGDNDGYTEEEGDCDDRDDRVHPYATEVCDGKDTDCSAGIPANEVDADDDGQRICEGDCDDNNALTYVGANEVCDGKDNDCNHYISATEMDDDGDGFSECQDDCDDFDPKTFPGATERCNNEDDNCDGRIPTDESDEDNDGYAICEGDCDDTDADTNPDQSDRPGDGIDNDCDGEVDNSGCSAERYIGSDGIPSRSALPFLLLLGLALRRFRTRSATDRQPNGNSSH